MYPIDGKKYRLQARLTQKMYFWPKIKIFTLAHLKNADLQQITLFIILNRYYLQNIIYDLTFLVYKDKFQ